MIRLIWILQQPSKTFLDKMIVFDCILCIYNISPIVILIGIISTTKFRILCYILPFVRKVKHKRFLLNKNNVENFIHYNSKEEEKNKISNSFPLFTGIWRLSQFLWKDVLEYVVLSSAPLSKPLIQPLISFLVDDLMDFYLLNTNEICFVSKVLSVSSLTSVTDY